MIEWVDIAKTIADLGFTVIAAGFVIWELYSLVKRQDKKNNTQEKIDVENTRLKNERFEQLIDNLEKKQNELYEIIERNQKKTEERYDSLLAKMIEYLQRPHLLTAEENDRMTKIDEEIDLLLEKTLTACDASRVSLIKYHNGGNDMLGNSILKMSMVNEKCAAGITHVQHSFQNQLRSFSTFLIKELNDNGTCFIGNIEDIKDFDSSLYQYLKQIGVKAKFVRAINDIKNGSVIGYISIDFIRTDNIDMKQVNRCLNDKKMKIEALLNLK